MEKKKVYLDNSATTAVNPDVVKAMQPYFSDIYGNASSFHMFGRESKEALENSRKKVATLLNAEPEEIIFTGCGTESDNIALFGVLNAFGKKGHIITTSVEHHAVLYACRHLETLGYEVTYLGVDKDGVISLDEFKKAVKENTLLVTIMHANNEVGSLQPVEEIGEELKKINQGRKEVIYFHTDAVQTAGKVPLDVKKMGVDLLSLTAHKFNGPKGCGALYIKKGTNIVSVMYGGHHENALRPGTENVPGIVGLAKALEISVADMSGHDKRILYLREKLKQGILDNIAEVTINGSNEKAISNILNVSFKYIEGESLLAMLDMKGIAASTGSACASGEAGASHVLVAMNADPLAAQGAIRFSFGYQNTEEEIDYVLDVLPEIVKNLRAMSPVYRADK